MQKFYHYHVSYICWKVIVVPFDVRTEVWMSKLFIQMFLMQYGGGIMLMAQLQVLEHLAQSFHLHGHTLNIPISNESQGNYSCCLPDRSVCSNHSVVIQSGKL